MGGIAKPPSQTLPPREGEGLGLGVKIAYNSVWYKAEFASSSGHVPKYEHTKSQKTFSKFREVKLPKCLIVNDLRYQKLLSMLGVRDGK